MSEMLKLSPCEMSAQTLKTNVLVFSNYEFFPAHVDLAYTTKISPTCNFNTRNLLDIFSIFYSVWEEEKKKFPVAIFCLLPSVFSWAGKCLL